MNSALLRLRKIHALSRRELAKRANVHEITIYRAEHGLTQLRPSTITKLSAALRVAPGAIAGNHDIVPTDFRGFVEPASLPTVISLFTGGMGFDLGFFRQGFTARVAVDIDPSVAGTVQANSMPIPVISKNIADIATSEILRVAGLKVGEATVVVGAPPCEPFTTVGSRNGFRDFRADAVHQFIRVVREARPEYFAFEQVPGFLRAAKRHMSYYKRAKLRESEIDPEYRLGSAFEGILEEFGSLGYELSVDSSNPKGSLLNSADFGSPQIRKRFVLVGSRNGSKVRLPRPTHANPNTATKAARAFQPWATLRNAIGEMPSSPGEHLEFPQKWGKFLRFVPPGGCWRHIPEEFHAEALGGAYDDKSNPDTAGLKGGRTGYLRRLSWDRPAPTLVDAPTNKASCLCHPDHTRPLTVAEYARIQGFGDEWIFAGTLSQRYRLIGQATPVDLASAIAATIRAHRYSD